MDNHLGIISITCIHYVSSTCIIIVGKSLCELNLDLPQSSFDVYIYEYNNSKCHSKSIWPNVCQHVLIQAHLFKFAESLLMD